MQGGRAAVSRRHLVIRVAAVVLAIEASIAIVIVGLPSAENKTGEPVSQASLGMEPTVGEQVAVVTGRNDVELTALGTHGWFNRGRPSTWGFPNHYKPYVDLLTRDEFIVDDTTQQLISYARGTAIYERPADLPIRDGEPSRAEVYVMAEEAARMEAPEFDISPTRRTALRYLVRTTTGNDEITYHFTYTTYVNGVNMPEKLNVVITLPVSTWTPSHSVWPEVEPYEMVPEPEITMLEALELASEAGGLSSFEVVQADLAYTEGEYVWRLVIGSSLETDVVYVNIDALSGEVSAVWWPRSYLASPAEPMDS